MMKTKILLSFLQIQRKLFSGVFGFVHPVIIMKSISYILLLKSNG